MSIDRNRKYRFSSGTFVANKINPDLEDTDPVEAPVTKFRRILNDSSKSSMESATQRKLQAMAKNAKENGGNSSTMNAEYLSKIPARQHNQITMASAGDKLKELKTNMTEEITKTSQDEAVTDILTETANDNIVYKNYNMSDLDKYMENINSMTLFEAISLKNSITRELNRLESCNTMIKAVDELRDNFDFVEPGKEPTIMDRKNAGTNVDKKLLAANYLDSYGYNESAEEFTELYSVYQPKLIELTEKLNTRITECSVHAGSTKYLTENFLKIIDKKLNNIDMNALNAEKTKASVLVLREAFGNRCDVNYLENKISNFAKNKNHLKAIVKAFNGTFSDIASKMNQSFAIKTMHSLVNMLNITFDNDLNKSLEFIYFLNYICATEHQSNKTAWVKVLVLNLGDIDKNIWDLDSMSGEEYVKLIHDTFDPYLNQINLYVTNRNTKISSSIQSQYNILMNWTEPKEAEETTESEDINEPNDNIEHVDAEIVESTYIPSITNVIDADYTEA